MATIITKLIDGHGPYVYRATYSEPGNYDWEYLGPAGSIDAADLTEDELEQLRDEKVLSKFRDETKADFFNRDIANEVRDELLDRYGPDVLSLEDDRRSSEITIAEDAPRAAEKLAEQEARDDQERGKTIGQADLTEDEKKNLDFSKKSIFHARAAKAVLEDEGIDDWQSLYDPQVVDPAGFREIARDNRESIRGERMDEDSDNVSLSREQADNELEKSARAAAAEGVREAQDALRQDFAYTDDQISELTA